MSPLDYVNNISMEGPCLLLQKLQEDLTARVNQLTQSFCPLERRTLYFPFFEVKYEFIQWEQVNQSYYKFNTEDTGVDSTLFFLHKNRSIPNMENEIIFLTEEIPIQIISNSTSHNSDD